MRTGQSPTDPDARIAKLKDGRTHLAYKAEHVVDLESELILAAEVYHADQADQHTLVDSVMEAQVHLNEAGVETTIEEVAADKGYHAADEIELAESLCLRTYIPEPERKHKSRWTGKPPELKRAVYANRRRTKTDKSKRLQRLRSERNERSFAHVCETGGARRLWLCGIEKIRKRHVIAALARNLGLLMRALFGMGTPRGLQPEGDNGDGLASLLHLARLVARSFSAALATIATFPSTLRQRAALQSAPALAA